MELQQLRGRTSAESALGAPEGGTDSQRECQKPQQSVIPVSSIFPAQRLVAPASRKEDNEAASIGFVAHLARKG